MNKYCNISTLCHNAGMELDISKLPDDSESLKLIISDLQGQFTGLKDQYDKETGILLEQIRHLRGKLFGRKSEKLPVDTDVQPLLLFDMPEPEDVEAEEPEEEVSVPAHTRKKRGRRPLPDDLPRIEVVHDISDEEKACKCGCALTRIGEEVSEQLDIIPAKAQVIKNIRPKYACRNCEGLDSDGPTVRIAPVPLQIIPKSIASPGLLAHVLTGKFVDSLPFYRQEKQFTRIGVDLSRSSMCHWAMKAAEACRPLYNLFQDAVLSGTSISADETTVQVLKEPGKSPTSKSYMWIFRRGDPKTPVLIYQYHPTRSAKVVSEFLCGYSGYVQTDGYSGYDFLDIDPNIRHIGCWAHARRKFMDMVKARGKNKKNGSGEVALSYIRKLYRVESEAKKKNLSYEGIFQLRQEKAVPILEEFQKWLFKRSLQTPPKGLLGKAISYTLRQWDRLIGYLEDGRLSPDNNAAENAIRPFVVGRKNWLFSGTPEGAEASAIIYSLIETAKANLLEPYSYLRHIFEKIPTANSLEELDLLLPWNLDAQELALVAMGKAVK